MARNRGIGHGGFRIYLALGNSAFRQATRKRAQARQTMRRGQLLGLDRWQAEEFLAHHNAQRPFTFEDIELERGSGGRR